MYVFLWKCNPAHDKEVLDFNSYKENKSPFKYFQKSPPSTVTFESGVNGLYN